MKQFLVLLNVCILLAMQGCSSNQDPEIPETNDPNPTISHLVVKFEGKIYETDVMTVGDSVTYLNPEYAELYSSKIAIMKDVAATVSKDENETTYVEYFPSEEQLLKTHQFFQLEENTETTLPSPTRANDINLWNPNIPTTILAVANLYDDRNLKDRKLIAFATTNWANSVPRLKDLGFNDKTSSIELENRMSPGTSYRLFFYYDNQTGTPNQSGMMTAYGSSIRPVLKCYHNSDYSGTAIYCIAKPTGSSDNHIDHNLKDIKWNDRISSIAWILVTDNSLFQGPEPEIPAHPDC